MSNSMNEVVGVLIEEIDILEAERKAIIGTAPAKQLAAIIKATDFGWVIMGIDKKGNVKLANGGKTMRIDPRGARIKEVRI